MTNDLQRQPDESPCAYAERIKDILAILKGRIEAAYDLGHDIDDVINEIDQIIEGREPSSDDVSALKTAERQEDRTAFVSADCTEWVLNRVPGETDAQYEERLLLFVDAHQNGDSEILSELRYNLDDLDEDGNRINLADRILSDITAWNEMTAGGQSEIKVRLQGLPKSVLARLREIADQYPHATLDLVGGLLDDDKGKNPTP